MECLLCMAWDPSDNDSSLPWEVCGSLSLVCQAFSASWNWAKTCWLDVLAVDPRVRAISRLSRHMRMLLAYLA
jgi:hypothetical protein